MPDPHSDPRQPRRPRPVHILLAALLLAVLAMVLWPREAERADLPIPQPPGAATMPDPAPAPEN